MQGRSDPEGNSVKFTWIPYPEAGTARPPVERTSGHEAKASFVVPKADPGAAIHIILEVRDDGTPALHAYRRAIVTVALKCPLKEPLRSSAP